MEHIVTGLIVLETHRLEVCASSEARTISGDLYSMDTIKTHGYACNMFFESTMPLKSTMPLIWSKGECFAEQGLWVILRVPSLSFTERAFDGGIIITISLSDKTERVSDQTACTVEQIAL